MAIYTSRVGLRCFGVDLGWFGSGWVGLGWVGLAAVTNVYLKRAPSESYEYNSS